MAPGQHRCLLCRLRLFLEGDLNVGDGHDTGSITGIANHNSGLGVVCRVVCINAQVDQLRKAVVHLGSGLKLTACGNIINGQRNLNRGAVSALNTDLNIRNDGLLTHDVLTQIQFECHSLALCQIQLVVGAEVGVVGNAYTFSIAIDKDRALIAVTALGSLVGILANQLVSQFFVSGPAFAVLNIDVRDGGIAVIAVCIVIDNVVFQILAEAGRIVDTDCIQIQVITIGLGVIQQLKVGSTKCYTVLTVGTDVSLQHGHLVDAAVALFAGIQHPIAVHIVIAVVGIDRLVHDQVAVGIANLQDQSAGGVAGHADDIQAGAIEVECSDCHSVGIHMDLLGGTVGPGSHFAIVAVLAVDIVGIHIGDAVLTGSVFRLGSARIGCTLRLPSTIAGRFVIRLVVDVGTGGGGKVILVVDVGCGNHGDNTVVVLGFQQRTLHHIAIGIYGVIVLLVLDFVDEPVIRNCAIGTAVPGHGSGRIADLITHRHSVAIGCNNLVRKGGVLSEGIGGCILIVEQSFIHILDLTDTGQGTVLSELVIGQNRDVNGQAVVNHHCVGQSLGNPNNGKPDGGVGVVVMSLQQVAVGCRHALIIDILGSNLRHIGVLTACVAVDISGLGLAGIGSDGPGTLAVLRQNNNLVRCSLVIQLVAGRQHRQGACVDGIDVIQVVQQDLIIDHRLGDLNGVGDTAGLAGSLVNDGLTLRIDQIEAVGNVGGQPASLGRGGGLEGIVAQPVLVVQVCVVVGLVRTGGSLTFHGAAQIAVVAQNPLHIVDDTDIPAEGLGLQLVAIHSQGIMAVVVVEVGSGDYAVGAQDVIGSIVDIIAVLNSPAEDAVAVLIHLIGVCAGDHDGIHAVDFLDLAGESDLFHDLLGVGAGLTMANHCIGDGIACSTLGNCVSLSLGVESIVQNLDLGEQIFGQSLRCQSTGGGTGVDPGCHLQIKGIAHLVHVVSIGGSVGNVSSELLERILQVVLVRGIDIVLVRSSDLFQSRKSCLVCNGAVIGNVEGNRVHGCAQTGSQVQVGVASCLQGYTAFNRSGLTDDFVLGVGIALDGVGHTMLVEVTVAVVVNTVIIVSMRCAVQKAALCSALQLVCGHGAVQPEVPAVGRIFRAATARRTVEVELVSRAVGHEQDDQITVFLTVGLILRLDGGTQPIDGIECVVVVRTVTGFHAKSRDIQGSSRLECAGRKRLIARVHLIRACDIELTFDIVVGIIGIGTGLVENVKVCNSNLNVIGVGRILQLGFEGTQRSSQCFQTGRRVTIVILGVVGNTSVHRGRQVQHNDNVDTFDHGQAGGGQLDVDHAETLQVGGISGLIDLNGAGIGVLGVVVTCSVDNLQGNAGGFLAGVGDRQILVNTVDREILVALEHAQGQGHFCSIALAVVHGDRADLSGDGGIALHGDGGGINGDTHSFFLDDRNADGLGQGNGLAVCFGQGCGNGCVTCGNRGHFTILVHSGHLGIAAGPGEQVVVLKNTAVIGNGSFQLLVAVNDHIQALGRHIQGNVGSLGSDRNRQLNGPAQCDAVDGGQSGGDVGGAAGSFRGQSAVIHGNDLIIAGRPGDGAAGDGGTVSQSHLVNQILGGFGGHLSRHLQLEGDRSAGSSLLLEQIHTARRLIPLPRTASISQIVATIPNGIRSTSLRSHSQNLTAIIQNVIIAEPYSLGTVNNVPTITTGVECPHTSRFICKAAIDGAIAANSNLLSGTRTTVVSKRIGFAGVCTNNQVFCAIINAISIQLICSSAGQITFTLLILTGNGSVVLTGTGYKDSEVGGLKGDIAVGHIGDGHLGHGHAIVGDIVDQGVFGIAGDGDSSGAGVIHEAFHINVISHEALCQNSGSSLECSALGNSSNIQSGCAGNTDLQAHIGLGMDKVLVEHFDLEGSGHIAIGQGDGLNAGRGHVGHNEGIAVGHSLADGEQILFHILRAVLGIDSGGGQVDHIQGLAHQVSGSATVVHSHVRQRITLGNCQVAVDKHAFQLGGEADIGQIAILGNQLIGDRSQFIVLAHMVQHQAIGIDVVVLLEVVGDLIVCIMAFQSHIEGKAIDKGLRNEVLVLGVDIVGGDSGQAGGRGLHVVAFFAFIVNHCGAPNLVGGSARGLGSLRNHRLGGLRNLGLSRLGMVTLHGLVHGKAARVDTILVIGNIADGILENLNSQSGAQAGVCLGAAAGSLRIHVTCVNMGEVQNNILRFQVGAVAGTGQDLGGGHGHSFALGIVVGLLIVVILMVMSKEICHVHVCRHFIDGSNPLISITIVATVIKQGLVTHDEQGLGLVQAGSGGLEGRNMICDLTCAVETGFVAVPAGQVGHAHQVHIVIAGVYQTAFLADIGSSPVMIGPDVVHRHVEHIVHPVGDGAGIAGHIALVGRVHVTGAINRADIRNVLFDSVQDIDNQLFLSVCLACVGIDVQVGHNDQRIHGSFRGLCFDGDGGQQTNQHHQAQNQANYTFHSFHNNTSLNFFKLIHDRIPRPQMGLVHLIIILYITL